MEENGWRQKRGVDVKLASKFDFSTDALVAYPDLWSPWKAHQTESRGGGYLAGSQRVARATTTWVHASARIWGETWAQSMKIPQFWTYLGDGHTP